MSYDNFDNSTINELKNHLIRNQLNIINDFVVISDNKLYIIDESIGNDEEPNLAIYYEFNLDKTASKEDILTIKEWIINDIYRNGRFSERLREQTKWLSRDLGKDNTADRKSGGIGSKQSTNDTKGIQEKNESSRGLKYSKFLEEKTLKNPDWYKEQLEKERTSWIKDYEYKVIDIERLVKYNYLGDGRLVIR